LPITSRLAVLLTCTRPRGRSSINHLAYRCFVLSYSRRFLVGRSRRRRARLTDSTAVKITSGHKWIGSELAPRSEYLSGRDVSTTEIDTPTTSSIVTSLHLAPRTSELEVRRRVAFQHFENLRRAFLASLWNERKCNDFKCVRKPT